MKRLYAVFLPVAFVLLGSTVQHVYCSEQTLMTQAQPAQDHTGPQKESKDPGDMQVEQGGEQSQSPAQASPELPTQTASSMEEEISHCSVLLEERDQQATETDMKNAKVSVEHMQTPAVNGERDPGPDAADTSKYVFQEDELVLVTPEVSTPLSKTPSSAAPSALVLEETSNKPGSPETPPSKPVSPETPPNSVPEVLVDTSIVNEPSNGDCEAGEGPSYNTDISSDPPVVIENGSNTGTGLRSVASMESSIDHTNQRTNASRMFKDQGTHIDMVTEPSVSSEDPVDIPDFDEWTSEDPENIPTFDEWMEVENEKSQSVHTSFSETAPAGKKVQKPFTNYASVECGAKILASNPEAKSTSAILMENMDMYMLNPCSNKIWFVIELCQSIQVKQLDIANFELFSSTPKDFLVSISDRYPTSKWVKLGTFHARDERTIQSFPLDEPRYAKYVKVELLSHFGAEHFCPLSLIRVFGTTMMDEYEGLNSQDDDDDYPPGSMPSEDKSSKNLIGSAKDAILNMVNNIAANVLGGGPDGEGNQTTHGENVTETTSSVIPDSPITTTLTPASTVLEIVEVDQPGPKESVMTPTQETTVDPIAPVPETPITETLTTDVPLSMPPEEPQIVILLPNDEDDSDQSSSTMAGEKEQEETDIKRKEPQDSQLESLFYSEESPDHLHAVSLKEYLLQHCASLLTLRRRRKKVPESQSRPHVPPSWQWITPTSAVTWVPSPYPSEHHLPSCMPGEQNSHTEVPPAHVEQDVPVTGSVDLAPSLTSALPKPIITDTLSTKATQTVDFLDPSSVDQAQVELKKSTPLTSISASFTSSGISSSSDSLEQSLQREELPDPERAIPRPTATVAKTTTVDPTLPPLGPISTPTEQPSQASTETLTTVPDHAQGFGPELTILDSSMVAMEPKAEEPKEDTGHSSNKSAGQPSPSQPPPSSSPSDFYAEMQSEPMGGGSGQPHGSNQKESVFMRLNNRIKALEMNMSLSGRYLEQLSQRYRKQMEEMQRAFNKTIIKLQNTSRIAEEQDQKQTESIQSLQGQLENVTQLVLNLSLRVSQLQREVADRHSYLLVCLVLCVLLGLLLCAGQCRISSPPLSRDHHTSVSKSYSRCCPQRNASPEDELGLRRTASYPLLQSAFQIPTTEGPSEAYNVESLRQSPNDKKKKRCKLKPGEKPDTLSYPSISAPLVGNGGFQCNGIHRTDLKPSDGGPGPPPLSFRDPQSEGSSEGSSQSDEPSFCGIGACSRLCDMTPPAPRGHVERRTYKRRRSKASCGVVELLQAPRRSSNPQGLTKDTKDVTASTPGGVMANGPS
ncbi:SUN domain-containing ossification factor isoform X2 [Chanos chanos]|uniref:SUN domain-containing ossification factor isoform X2 n=1 Tax=Chanos chanos TaxID=29144 RepID=A0A6J2V7Y4_CHACN|nr:SUN domain-containing ossification factor-like isoform X2 [Chanos chanos]